MNGWVLMVPGAMFAVIGTIGLSDTWTAAGFTLMIMGVAVFVGG